MRDTPPEGRHRLCGSCSVGIDWKSFIATQVLVLIPIVFFFALVAPDVGNRVSWAPVVILAVLSLITYAALLTTGFRNPGTIPRSEPASIPDLRTAVYIVNGHEVITKYCTTCHLYRPPRCSHCAMCDTCIEKFDHHCPWVGTCIGRRNYQPFLTFIFCATLSCLLFIALSVVRLVHVANEDGSDFHRALREEWAAAVVAVFCCVGALFVGALSAFHAFLLLTNQTTYEYFRGRGSDNSFHRSCIKNFVETACGQTRLYKYHPDGTHPTLMSPSAAEQTARGSALHRPAAHNSTLRHTTTDSFTERNGESTSYHNALHNNGHAFAGGAQPVPPQRTYDDDAMLPTLPGNVEMTSLRHDEHPQWDHAAPLRQSAHKAHYSNGGAHLQSPLPYNSAAQRCTPQQSYSRELPPAQAIQHESLQPQSPLRPPVPSRQGAGTQHGAPTQGLPPPQHADVRTRSRRSQPHYSGRDWHEEQDDPAVRAYAQVARSGREDAPQRRRNDDSAVDRPPRRVCIRTAIAS